MTGILGEWTRRVHREGERLLAPLIGLPGVRLAGTTVKLAQQNPSIHAHVLDSIVRAFAPDVIFPVMELTVEANALGRPTSFPVDEPPTVLQGPLREGDLAAMESVDISSDARALAYCETVRRAVGRHSPAVFVGSYVTGPYTLAALILGAEEAALATKLSKEDLHAVLAVSRKAIDQYIRMLIRAGSAAVCILEPSAVMLGPKAFSEFSAAYVSSLRATCDEAGVPAILHVCGGSMHLIEAMADTGVDGLSLDSKEAGVDLAAVSHRIPPETVILGNISPTSTMLFGHPDQVRHEVAELADLLRDVPNFILSTGCDLPLDTPLENIRAFMEAGRHLSQSRRSP